MVTLTAVLGWRSLSLYSTRSHATVFEFLPKQVTTDFIYSNGTATKTLPKQLTKDLSTRMPLLSNS